MLDCKTGQVRQLNVICLWFLEHKLQEHPNSKYCAVFYIKRFLAPNKRIPQQRMPRLPTSLLRRARHIHPLLPRLLRPCRDLESAQNELRWLREHAIEKGEVEGERARWQSKLDRLCRERERGRPLQYILGSQPFGNLDILCRSKVLIPR